MQLAVIALIRNEADIFPAFAQHLAALFDTALFLDHGSTDGTSALVEEACAQKPGWSRWNVTVAGMHQGLFSAFALRHVFATTDAEAVFLLDADEFIDVADRQGLIDALAFPRDARCVPCLEWRHAVPYPVTEAPLRAGDTLLVSPVASAFTKVIVTRALFTATGGALQPSAGSHVIDPGDGVALTQVVIGTILHVPLRSIGQMTRKTLIAALSHLARTDRAAHEGAHRFDALTRIRAGTMDTQDLVGWASAYGEPGAAAQPKSFETLLREGFLPRRLDVPHATLAFRQLPTGEQPLQAIAAALISWRPHASAGLDLVLDGTTLRARTPEAVPGVSPDHAALEQVRAERDLARHEVSALRASTSWRITAPLRTMVALVRKSLGGSAPRPGTGS